MKDKYSEKIKKLEDEAEAIFIAKWMIALIVVGLLIAFFDLNPWTW